jgi:succinate dehydrogenase / fumarate reductase cytochrome b subunit
LSAKPRELANVGAGLWKGTGMWAWLLFRISGVLLSLYLLAHIVIISTARWTSAGSTFDSIMKTFDKAPFVVLDLALVVAVLYHALNGVRIILMDFGVGVGRHKIVFWSCIAVVVICFAIFAWVAFSFIANPEQLGPFNSPASLVGVFA